MSIFDVVFHPIRFAFHRGSSSIKTGFAGLGAGMSAKMDMSALRFQLSSYEGRELFDSKRLSKHLKMYGYYKKHILRYRAKKEHGQLVSPRIEKVFHKYKDKADLLNKVLAHEVQIFAGFYENLLRVISTIQMEEGDLVLQKNASLITDEDKMKTLITRVPVIAKEKNITLVTDDFKQFLDKVEHEAAWEERMEIREFRERRKEVSGARKFVSGTASLFGSMTGIGHLGHKIFKLSRKVYSHDVRRFDREFTELQSEIEHGNITPATIAKLRFLFKNYKKIRKYYANIDKDIMLILNALFKDFDMLLNECVVPFYAAVKNVHGADVIMKITNELKAAHQKFMVEGKKEEFEIKAVLQHLQALVTTCKTALGDVQEQNKQVIQNLQQQMSAEVKAPAKAA
ncbi:MAG: hypothetical protein KJ574_00825 [Nanoarchaeota archaeon]|nr:hypothetical protein [Nanoarchaeota archaeon]